MGCCPGLHRTVARRFPHIQQAAGIVPAKEAVPTYRIPHPDSVPDIVQAAAVELDAGGFIDWPGVELVEVTDSESSDSSDEESGSDGEDGLEAGSSSSGEEEGEEEKRGTRPAAASGKADGAAGRGWPAKRARAT